MDYIDANVLWDWCFTGRYAAYLSQAVAEGSACTSLFTLVEMRFSMVAKGMSRIAASAKIRAILASGITLVSISEKDFLFALEAEARGLQLYDAIHAAICISQGYRMASADSDFRKLKGFDVFVPPA